MSNLNDENLTVYCPICNNDKQMKQITHKHLKNHDLTIEKFKNKYPECYLVHPIREEQLKKARLEGKRKKDNTLVTKPCWNYANCKNKVEGVNINVGSIYTICEECESKGL